MLQTKYITPDELDQYFPELKISIALGSKENTLAFLTRIEDRMETYINANFNKNIDAMYPTFNDYQKRQYKLALLEQAVYIFRNSEISVDSGMDDNGVKVSRGTIRNLSIAENARQHLILCGVWNRHIGKTSKGWLGLW